MQHSNRTATQIPQKNYQMFEKSVMHGYCFFAMNFNVQNVLANSFSYLQLLNVEPHASTPVCMNKQLAISTYIINLGTLLCL